MAHRSTTERIASMNITLTWGDFLMIAAIVVIFARAGQATFSGPTPRQLRMQRQLDAIMKHLGVAEPPESRPGALSPEVAALVTAGRKIEAIKLYRQETGVGLKPAKDAVECALAAAAAATNR
jgi:hypothetical protein